MSPSVKRMAERLREAEHQCAQEVEAPEQRWHYRVHHGRVWFDKEMRRAHRRFRQSIPAYIREGSVRSLLTAPIIYSLLLPLALLDVWVTLYQWVCFPIYRIACVPRRAYFVIDRHKLGYLNGIEKINCTFCSYASGLFAYVREVAACTEQYWCPIKHARPIRRPHERYQQFLDYGDAEGYRRELTAVRRTLNRPAGRRDPGRKTPPGV